MHIYFLQTFVSSLFPFQTTNIFLSLSCSFYPFSLNFSFFSESVFCLKLVYIRIFIEMKNQTKLKRKMCTPNQKKKQKRWMQISHNKVIALDTKIREREYTHTYKKNVRTIFHCGHHENEKGYTKKTPGRVFLALGWCDDLCSTRSLLFYLVTKINFTNLHNLSFITMTIFHIRAKLHLHTHMQTLPKLFRFKICRKTHVCSVLYFQK